MARVRLRNVLETIHCRTFILYPCFSNSKAVWIQLNNCSFSGQHLITCNMKTRGSRTRQHWKVSTVIGSVLILENPWTLLASRNRRGRIDLWSTFMDGPTDNYGECSFLLVFWDIAIGGVLVQILEDQLTLHGPVCHVWGVLIKAHY